MPVSMSTAEPTMAAALPSTLLVWSTRSLVSTIDMMAKMATVPRMTSMAIGVQIPIRIFGLVFRLESILMSSMAMKGSYI